MPKSGTNAGGGGGPGFVPTNGAYQMVAPVNVTGTLAVSGDVAAAANLTVAGEIVASGDVTAFSDARLKANLALVDGLAAVRALAGYTFDRVDRADGRHAGLLAQDVAAVLPEAVRATPDGTLAVSHAGVVALLVEAVKDLARRVDALDARAPVSDRLATA